MTFLRFGGFPEPFLKGNEFAAKRWRRSHTDRILREDLRDLASVRDLKGIETLVELLRRSVGSMISYESLARDLQASPHTIKHWVSMLENLYILFVVTPYSRNIAIPNDFTNCDFEVVIPEGRRPIRNPGFYSGFRLPPE